MFYNGNGRFHKTKHVQQQIGARCACNVVGFRRVYIRCAKGRRLCVCGVCWFVSGVCLLAVALVRRVFRQLVFRFGFVAFD